MSNANKYAQFGKTHAKVNLPLKRVISVDIYIIWVFFLW